MRDDAEHAPEGLLGQNWQRHAGHPAAFRARRPRTPGEPVRRAELLAAGWDELVPPATNVLDVLIAQLRGKLGEPRVIHTVRGTGYLLGPAGHRNGW